MSEETLTQEDTTEDITQDEQQKTVKESNIETPHSSRKRKRENMAPIVEKNSKERLDAITCVAAHNEKLLNIKPVDDIDLICKSIALRIKGMPKKGQSEAKLKILGSVTDLEEKYSSREKLAVFQNSAQSFIPASDFSSMLSPTIVHSDSSCSVYTVNFVNFYL